MGDAVLSVNRDLKVDTTNAKIRVLRTLQGYWKVKGKFLQNKLDPTYGPSHPEFYREVAEYITLYTDLPALSKFWSAMQADTQDAFCRSLVFSDEVPTKFTVTCSEKLARVFIVLNGYASVASSLHVGVRVTYGQGQTFGHYHPFDALTRFEIAGRPSYDPLVVYQGEDEILDVVVEKGALLHIGMDHFCTDVWGHVPPEPEEDSYVDTRTDYEIAGLTIDTPLTEADISVIKVNRAAKRKLAGVLYDFMSSFDLMPKNAHHASSAGYLKHGDKGSHAYASVNTVYIVLDGTIRLQISKRGAAVKPGTLGTHTVDADDQQTDGIRVRATKLPLILMDAGTMCFLADECFTVGQDGTATLPSGTMKPHFRAALEQARAATTYPAPPPAAPKRDKKDRLVVDNFRTDIIYHLSLVFEKNSVFLAIPEVKFRLAMEECPAATAEAFHEQLCHFNDTTFARIVKLLPWIQGGTLDVAVAERERVMRADEEVVEDKEYTGVGFRGVNDDMLDTSLKGSFKHITMLGTYDDEEEAPSSSSIFLTAEPGPESATVRSP